MIPIIPSLPCSVAQLPGLLPASTPLMQLADWLIAEHPSSNVVHLHTSWLKQFRHGHWQETGTSPVVGLAQSG
jgi:hypothetical protein